MSDVSGIPNLGFGGGPIFAPGGGFGSLSAAQINSSMGFNPSAPAFNPWGGTTGGFGNQTAQYAAAGAGYGRATGGFGGYGGMNDPFSPVGGYNAMDAAANAPNYSFDNSQYLQGLDPSWFGQQPQAAQPDFSQLWANSGGQIPGQPYGPGYFDNTFGAANSQPQQTGFSPTQTYGEPGTGQGGYNPADIWGGAAWDYMQANPDVAAATNWNPAAAIQHYQTYGANEGRGGFGMPGGGNADAQAYLAANPDVAAAAAKAGGDPLQYARYHESQFGKGEGRGWGEATGAFKSYLDANPDVYNAAIHSGMDLNTFAAQHAQKYGGNEGRDVFGIPQSSEQRYFAANPDVAASGQSAAQHYQKYGHGEGREGFGLSFDDRFSAAPAVDYNLQGSPAPIPRGILTGDFNTQTPNSPGASFNERFGVFGDPTQGLNFTQQSQMPVPMTSRNWTFDSYGNPVPPGYGSTGGDMYSPSAYSPGYPDQFGGSNPGYGAGTAVSNAPGTGPIGPYSDPFSSYPWNGNPAANVDYRFVDPNNLYMQSQLQQTLGNIDKVSGGRSTLTPEDLSYYQRGGG